MTGLAPPEERFELEADITMGSGLYKIKLYSVTGCDLNSHCESI